MTRFFKLLTFSALLTAIVGGLFWFWDQSLSANVVPGGTSEGDGPYADADEMTEEQRKLLLQELESRLG